MQIREPIFFSGHIKVHSRRPADILRAVRTLHFHVVFVMVRDRDIQALITVLSIWGFVRYVLDHAHLRSVWITSVIVAVLSVVTGFAVFISHIMPDWYSPIVPLCE